MITRRDLEIAEQCTSGGDCAIHPTIAQIHDPLVGVDVETELGALVTLNEALESAIPDAWDGDDSWESIAAQWITHMATTHGAHCAGPHCTATAEVPAYVAALRRMWRDTEQYGTRPDHPFTATYRNAIEDLAHELGVNLDG